MTNKKRGLVSEADVALLREAFMAALERARAEAFQAETQEREGSE